MAERTRKMLAVVFLSGIVSMLLLRADELPEDEIQAALNGYFDNFRVNILYPTVALTKRISGSASITGRYLVDCITAASMRSRFVIDGVTSATSQKTIDAVSSASQRTAGYPKSTFDEVRHELNAGLFQLIGEGSSSLNALYSIEHDYRSWTIAGQVSYPFALKNTVLQLGFVRSWDSIFPDTRDWRRHKDVMTLSAGLTQVLSEIWIIQTNFSITRMSGFLSDPYQPVPVFQDDGFVLHETVLPDTRLRKAAGLRSNWMLSKKSSLQLGYRYYWDDWNIRSHTIHTLIQHYLADKDIALSLELRHYTQQHADFFRNEYTNEDKFLTVDSKLNNLWSNEVEIGTTIKGNYFYHGQFLYSEKTEYHVALGFYQRRTPIPDWFNGYNTLYVYTFSVGLRYHF